jgi:histidinol-phosphate phosphatase family protein
VYAHSPLTAYGVESKSGHEESILDCGSLGKDSSDKPSSKIDIFGYNTLFIDRDGTINQHRPNDYVKSWTEFEFLPGILDLLAACNKRFTHIIMITNQRGVGKNIMTESELNRLHENMLSEIKKYGGRIDKVYYCTAISDDDINRKPNIGVALQAKQDFPNIDFSKAIMLGDSECDRVFAQRLGAKMLFITSLI